MVWCCLRSIYALLLSMCLSPLCGDLFSEADDAEIVSQNRTLFVSLGSTCHSAMMLRHAGLRYAAYPLDWVLSMDGNKLIDGIRDGFAYLCDPRYLIVLKEKYGWLANTYYSIELVHEGNWLGNRFAHRWSKFREKYARRLARFHNIKEHEGTVYFFRAAMPEFFVSQGTYVFEDKENRVITPQYALRLYSALKEAFPKPNVRLIIFNFLPEIDREVLKVSDDIVMVWTDWAKGLEENVPSILVHF